MPRLSPVVESLVTLGPLPSEPDATEEQLRNIEVKLETIARPVSSQEACELATLFGDDNCFGLAWSLVHIFESAPGWPIARLTSALDPECMKSREHLDSRVGSALRRHSVAHESVFGCPNHSRFRDSARPEIGRISFHTTWGDCRHGRVERGRPGSWLERRDPGGLQCLGPVPPHVRAGVATPARTNPGTGKCL